MLEKRKGYFVKAGSVLSISLPGPFSHDLSLCSELPPLWHSWYISFSVIANCKASLPSHFANALDCALAAGVLLFSREWSRQTREAEVHPATSANFESVQNKVKKKTK